MNKSNTAMFSNTIPAWQYEITKKQERKQSKQMRSLRIAGKRNVWTEDS